MIAALLFSLLQLPGHSTATPADSAYARAALTRALAAYQSPPEPQYAFVDSRLIAQLRMWGMHEQAWSFAVRQDTAPLPVSSQRNRWLTAELLRELYQNQDTVGVGRHLDALPVGVRDGALQAVIIYINCPISQATERERLVARIRDRVQRARALGNSGYPCEPGDSARARSALRAAIDLLRNDTTPEAMNLIRPWLSNLKRYGGAVSDDEIKRVNNGVVFDSPWEPLNVAQSLLYRGERARAISILDSLQTHVREPSMRIIILNARQTTRDSATARALQDSLDASPRVFGRDSTERRQFAMYDAHSRLQRALDEMDSTRTRTALAAALHSIDPAGMLMISADFMRQRNNYPPSINPAGPSARQLEFARYLYRTLWLASVNLQPVTRDSARVAIVGLLASYDASRALSVARTQFRVARMRERATAEAAARLAATDADVAAAAARPLQDPSARNTAYLALTNRALAGGRLAAAARYADHTANGLARVQAQFAVANAMFAADSTAAARSRVVGLLDQLDPIRSCDGCGWAALPNTVLPPPMPGMSPYLIDGVMLLGFRSGAAPELRAWAGTRKTALAQLSAFLEIAEGMAQYRLGFRPSYPMY